jgi:D-xylose transport system substrate-binding protein
MEQILTKNNNKVDAVVASNDGTAGGVVAALSAQGLAVPFRCPDRMVTRPR